MDATGQFFAVDCEIVSTPASDAGVLTIIRIRLIGHAQDRVESAITRSACCTTAAARDQGGGEPIDDLAREGVAPRMGEDEAMDALITSSCNHHGPPRSHIG